VAIIRVFYDGHCGLCAKEIAYYRRIAPQNKFDWIDITKTGVIFESLGYTVAEGLKALHVQGVNGEVCVGVDAFIVIWRCLPAWRWLAKLVSLPIIHGLAVVIYRFFAAWRFKRLGYGSCGWSPNEK